MPCIQAGAQSPPGGRGRARAPARVRPLARSDPTRHGVVTAAAHEDSGGSADLTHPAVGVVHAHDERVERPAVQRRNARVTASRCVDEPQQVVDRVDLRARLGDRDDRTGVVDAPQVPVAPRQQARPPGRGRGPALALARRVSRSPTARRAGSPRRRSRASARRRSARRRRRDRCDRVEPALGDPEVQPLDDAPSTASDAAQRALELARPAGTARRRPRGGARPSAARRSARRSAGTVVAALEALEQVLAKARVAAHPGRPAATPPGGDAAQRDEPVAGAGLARAPRRAPA